MVAGEGCEGTARRRIGLVFGLLASTALAGEAVLCNTTPGSQTTR